MIDCKGIPEMKQKTGESGQALLEFAIMAVLLILLTAALLWFGYFFGLFGNRIADAVGMEYP